MLRHHFRPAAAEDVVRLAIVADEVTHVLNDPQHLHAELLEHPHRPGGVVQSDLLRRTYHHRTGQWQQLCQGQRDITRARRQIDDQVIQLAPIATIVHIYVREPHPEERSFKEYKQHADYDQKMAYARELVELKAITVPVVVDGMDEALNQMLGGLPNTIWSKRSRKNVE